MVELTLIKVDNKCHQLADFPAFFLVFHHSPHIGLKLLLPKAKSKLKSNLIDLLVNVGVFKNAKDI